MKLHIKVKDIQVIGHSIRFVDEDGEVRILKDVMPDISNVHPRGHRLEGMINVKTITKARMIKQLIHMVDDISFDIQRYGL